MNNYKDSEKYKKNNGIVPNEHTGISTGFAKLDEITNGLQGSNFIAILSRPEMGKTSLALSIAKNVAVEGKVPITYFSLEMDKKFLTNRLVSNMCQIDGKKIAKDDLDASEKRRIESTLSDLKNIPFYIDDTAGLSVSAFCSKTRQFVKEKEVKFVVVDYLQLMTVDGRKFSKREEEITYISRSLKELANELSITILGLLQLHPSDHGIYKYIIQQSDCFQFLRAIYPYSDIELFLESSRFREDTERNAYLWVPKHNCPSRPNGPISISLHFNPKCSCFQD